MKQWEARYEHERDVQAAHCESVGFPTPEEDQYGVLHRVPYLFRQFNGQTFWPALKKRNHTSVIFERCQCYVSENERISNSVG